MTPSTTTYFYLHGFASGPRSAKAVYLRDRFAAVGIKLQIPDLNQPDFFQLTLTRQIKQVEAALPTTPVVLIGSSLGGLTAAWVAQRQSQIKQLVLLAPAFQFLQQWLPKLSVNQQQQLLQGQMEFYHYAEQRPLPLSYEFIRDVEQYHDHQLLRPVSTLVLHGIHDQVISIAASQDFVKQRPWAHLIELNSNHALVDVKELIWQAIQTCCNQAARHSDQVPNRRDG